MRKILPALLWLGLASATVSCDMVPAVQDGPAKGLTATSQSDIAIHPTVVRNMTVRAEGPYNGNEGQFAVGKTLRIKWDGQPGDAFHHVRIEAITPQNTVITIAKEWIHQPQGSVELDWIVVKNVNYMYQYPNYPWNLPSGTYRLRFTPLVYNSSNVLVPAPGVWDLPIIINNYLNGNSYAWAPDGIYERPLTCQFPITITWDPARFRSSTIDIYGLESLDYPGIAGGYPMFDAKLATVPNNGHYDVQFNTIRSTAQSVLFRLSDSNDPDDFEITNIIPYECNDGTEDRIVNRK